MRGISEERLRELAKQIRNSDESNSAALSMLDFLLSECKELDPWLPIDENTPKDRPLLLKANCGTAIEGSFVDLDGGYWIDHFTHDEIYPTHYQELPAEPKE